MSQNAYDKLIMDCTWIVVRAITRGDKLEVAMHEVFAQMLAYFKALKK